MTLQAVDQEYVPLAHNLEVEQGLLGAIFVDNEIISRYPNLTAQHFYDPLHTRIFQTALDLINRGQTAQPVTLKTFLASDSGLKAVGGVDYLVKLSVSAVQSFYVEEWIGTLLELAQRRAVTAYAEHLSAQACNNSEPLADILDTAQTELARMSDDSTHSVELRHVAEASDNALKFVEEGLENPGQLRGATTGIKELDEAINGLQPGHHIVLAGRTSMGKSTVAGIIAKGAAQAGHGVGIFTPEMPAAEYMMRIQTAVAYDQEDPIHYVNALRNQIGKEHFARLIDAHRHIATWPLYIDATTGVTVEAVAAETKRLKRRMAREGKTLDAIVVDHIGKIRYQGTANMKVHQIEHIAGELKNLAKAEEIAVISVCQLNRSVDSRDNKRPMLSDLRDSGAIEQEADEVIFCYRPEYYLERNKPEGKARVEWEMSMNAARGKLEIIVAKQRMGPTLTLDLRVDIKSGVILGQEQGDML